MIHKWRCGKKFDIKSPCVYVKIVKHVCRQNECGMTMFLLSKNEARIITTLNNLWGLYFHITSIANLVKSKFSVTGMRISKS